MDILKLKFILRRINVRMFNSINRISLKSYNEYKSKEFSTGINFHLYNNNFNNFTLDTFLLYTGHLLLVKETKNEENESLRMKQFHQKLKLQPIPSK